MDLDNRTTQPNHINEGSWKTKTALFLSSQGLSLFGSMLVQYAIIWYVTLTTQSGIFLTLSTLVSFLPQIVISLFAGVWADRYPRKLLIIFADLLIALSTLGLAIAFLLGYRELWLLFLVSAIRSVGGGIQMPAVNALLPQIVPQDRLIKVNSINGTIQPFIMIAAPLVSGGLMSFAMLESIFFIDVVTAMLAVGLLLALKVPVHEKAAQARIGGYFDDLKAGLGYIQATPVIKSLFVFYAAVFFLATPAIFLTPLLVTRSFGDDVWRLTANEVTFFVGSIIGGVIMTIWGGFKNHFRTIGLACILWAVLFAGLGLSRDFILYLVIMFLAGIPMPMFSVPATTLLQQIVKPDMQGRVFGVNQLITTTVLPAGMIIFGPIADVITVEALLVIASTAMGIPALWIFFNRRFNQAVRAMASSDYKLQPGD